MNTSQYIDVSVAQRNPKYLPMLHAETIRRLCREGILFGVKFGDNRKGFGRWKILVSSIAEYRIQNETIPQQTYERNRHPNRNPNRRELSPTKHR